MAENLIYVGGSGRSGSTLLDLLLNNSSEVQSLGEVHRLNWYARTDKEPCTCGAPVFECPFWLQVQAEALHGNEQANEQAFGHASSAHVRTPGRASLLSGDPWRSRGC